MKQKDPKKRVGIQVFPETMESLRRLRAEIEIETGERLSMDGVIQRLVECGKTMLKVKETLKMEDFKATMDGIYTTCVSSRTIDESPMAYKPMEEIVANIKDTAEIVKTIKPIYNFKAEE